MIPHWYDVRSGWGSGRPIVEYAPKTQKISADKYVLSLLYRYIGVSFAHFLAMLVPWVQKCDLYLFKNCKKCDKLPNCDQNVANILWLKHYVVVVWIT